MKAFIVLATIAALSLPTGAMAKSHKPCAKHQRIKYEGPWYYTYKGSLPPTMLAFIDPHLNAGG